MVSAPIDLEGVAVAGLVQRLNSEGVVCLEGVVSSDWIEAVRLGVSDHVSVHGEGDFLTVDPGDEPDTPAWQLASDPNLRLLLAQLSGAAWQGGRLDTAQKWAGRS